MNWKQYKEEFVWDGSLRDLYVTETTVADWDKFLTFLRTQRYTTSFERGGTDVEVPSETGELFPASPQSLLSLLRIDVGGIAINAHFFTPNEIELDLDPRSINSEERLDCLFRFMSALADALAKEVVMTPEGGRDHVVFKARPGFSTVQYCK